MNWISGTTFQFQCTNSWSTDLLIAAADSTFRYFALVRAGDTYGPQFTVTMGAEAVTEHTAKVLLKTSDVRAFIDEIIRRLPLSTPAPHSRPACSMMTHNAWTEQLSLQFIAGKCRQLALPCTIASRAESSFDMVVNRAHRVQVKATRDA